MPFNVAHRPTTSFVHEVHIYLSEGVISAAMQSQPSYPTPESDTSPKETTSAQIERLSTTWVNTLNNRDFSFTSPEAQDLIAHLAPDFRARIDTDPSNPFHLSLDEQIVKWRERAEQHPDVYFKIVLISSDVDEAKGVASVYLNMEVSGIGEVMLSAMNELRWRREDERWLCYYVIGMRGSMGNTGGYG